MNVKCARELSVEKLSDTKRDKLRNERQKPV